MAQSMQPHIAAARNGTYFKRRYKVVIKSKSFPDLLHADDIIGEKVVGVDRLKQALSRVS